MLVVLVLPSLETAWVIGVGVVVVDDGPMIICDMGMDDVIETVTGLVLIVTDGIPATVEHKFSKSSNENA